MLRWGYVTDLPEQVKQDRDADSWESFKPPQGLLQARMKKCPRELTMWIKATNYQTNEVVSAIAASNDIIASQLASPMSVVGNKFL